MEDNISDFNFDELLNPFLTDGEMETKNIYLIPQTMDKNYMKSTILILQKMAVIKWGFKEFERFIMAKVRENWK